MLQNITSCSEPEGVNEMKSVKMGQILHHPRSVKFIVQYDISEFF